MPRSKKTAKATKTARPTKSEPEPVYIPSLPAAADEAVARLRVVKQMTQGITNGDYDTCDGYEVSIIEDLIDGVIRLLATSNEDQDRRRNEQGGAR